MRYIFHLFLIFISIFSPKVPFIYNGTILAGIISIFVIFLDRATQERFLFFIKKKYIIRILALPIVLAILSIFITTIHFEYDYSIVKTFINQSISLSIVMLVVSVVNNDREQDERYIHRLIFTVFALQTVIILIAFFNSSFLRFVQLFQNEEILSRSSSRGGIRTLMLATTAYFGLGITYGFVYIIYFKSILQKEKSSIFTIFVLSLLLVGTFFVARTGFIGFVIGLCFYYASNVKLKNKLIFARSAFLYLIIIFISILLFIPFEMVENFNKNVIPFAFEMFRNDGFQTSSTSHLFEMWKIDIDAKTFLIGDGKYLNSDGSYYKHTDVGYLRNILFGGVGFFMLLLGYQLYMIVLPLWKQYVVEKKSNWLFISTIIVFLLITHAKGEVIGFSRTLLITMFMYLLPIFYFKNENITDNK